MPRTVYHQCPGNPIQSGKVPSEQLSIEFAYRDGVDNDDAAFTQSVIRQLYFTSFVAVCGCWLQLWLLNTTLLTVLVLLLLFNSLIVKSVTRLTTVRNCSVLAIVATWIYHFAPVPYTVEIYFALTANLLVAREVGRHFTFVATSAPTPVETAWRTRQSACWKTSVSSLLLVPLSFSVLLPGHATNIIALVAIGWLLLAFMFGADPKTYVAGFRDAIVSWCSYNRTEKKIPGILISPSGCCGTRLTMLFVVVLLNVFLCFRLTFVLQFTEAIIQIGRVASATTALDVVIHGAIMVFSITGLIAVPMLFLFVSILIAGTPVFGTLSVSAVGKSSWQDWQAVTDSMRVSENRVERNSFYLGRIAHDQSPLVVPTEVFQEHAHFLGDSGSGKTSRGLAPFIEQTVGTGTASVMVIDMKGDSPELLETLKCGARTARQLTGTDVPVRYFTLRDDQSTYGFNPFRMSCWNQLNDFQKTDTLCGGLGLIYGTDYGEGFYSSANAAVLHATITHFPGIQSFEELRDKLSFVLARPQSHGLDEKCRDAANHIKMIVTRLASLLPVNITTDISPNPDVADGCIDPSQLFDHPEAHFYSLSSTLGPGSSPEIGRLATFLLMTTATLSDNRIPVYLVIDEFQRMATRNLDYLLQLARSMDVAVILANQSMQDLHRYDLIPTLQTNCRYRQWFAISGWDDQDEISKASGETVDSLEAWSITESSNSRGNTTSTTQSSHQLITPRLTKNDIKLVSDDDSKSIVLINRGAGYAQYGGMPFVVESDFHISPEEYERRKSTPWPSTDAGTFIPKEWKRPAVPIPHRGRAKNQAPNITHETIVANTQESKEQDASRAKSKSRRRKKSKSAKQPVSTNGDLFENYFRDNPIESSHSSGVEQEGER